MTLIFPAYLGAVDIQGDNLIILGSVTVNGGYFGNGQSLSGVIPSSATGTYPHSITGNSASVTNGLYSNLSYNDPTWITHLSPSKIDLSTVTSAIALMIPSSATGSYPLSITGTVPAASVSAGHLGGSVIASSITLAAMYGSPTLTGTNITAIPNAALVTPVIPSSATGTYPLSISGTAQTATYAVTTSSDAYWNAKQAAGSYITSLTGGVTASGPGASAATVVTNANLTGPITSAGNATTIVGPVPVATIDLSTVTSAIVLRVLKSGDTMTGPLTLTGAGSYVTTVSSMSAASAVIGGNTFNGNFTSTGIISGNGSGLTALKAANVTGALTVSSVTFTSASGIKWLDGTTSTTAAAGGGGGGSAATLATFSGAPTSTPTALGAILISSNSANIYQGVCTTGYWCWTFLKQGSFYEWTASAPAGLTSWYKADLGVTPTTAGSTLTGWNDWSTTGNHLTYVTGTPKVSTITQNGLPMVYFDGAAAIYSDDKADTNQPNTYFIAFLPTSWGTGAGQSIFSMYDSTWLGKSNLAATAVVSAGTGLTGATLSSNNKYLITSVINGNSSTISINGGADTSGAAGAGVNSNRPFIGSLGGGVYPYTGYVMEILVYSGALSAADQAKVRNYLNGKWAIY